MNRPRETRDPMTLSANVVSTNEIDALRRSLEELLEYGRDREVIQFLIGMCRRGKVALWEYDPVDRIRWWWIATEIPPTRESLDMSDFFIALHIHLFLKRVLLFTTDHSPRLAMRPRPDVPGDEIERVVKSVIQRTEGLIPPTWDERK